MKTKKSVGPGQPRRQTERMSFNLLRSAWAILSEAIIEAGYIRKHKDGDRAAWGEFLEELAHMIESGEWKIPKKKA